MGLIVDFSKFFYQSVAKPIFFRINPELVHTQMVKTGEFMGNTGINKLVNVFFGYQNPALSQTINNITFPTPIGLAAGFDYEARLTQILYALSFGFQTVGTVTNSEYEGNPKPMLGRLPQSKSLMVNKGFKNPGADAIAKKLKSLQFPIPLGISIGRSNSRGKGLTQEESVWDIVNSFQIFETAKIKNSYYELNISCPNLFGTVSFYEPQKLHDLLTEIDSHKLSKPVFVKMPITKSLEETRIILEAIAKHSPVGVIIGNLQTNRKHTALIPKEAEKFPVGNFSGKPTFDDSNERISMCRNEFGKRFTIIGCGGVFSAKDAWEKIQRGASLVQMITGMIYEGPQVVAEINMELMNILKKKGYTSITQGIGK